MAERLSMEEAKINLDKDTSIILLDVRTREEYALGHIEGAVNIPLQELEESAEEELADKEQTIYLYCRSGVRTLSAASILEELGYNKVYDIGGIIAWPYEIVK